jgi:hypothetical protein
MADAKTTALTAETAPVDADLLYMIDDVAGTPTSKKVTFANAAAAAPFSSRYAGLPVFSTVLTSEVGTSTSYAGLTTAHTATVTVPASGNIIVGVTVDISCNQTTTSRVSFALSGANTLAASDDNSIRSELSANFVQTESMLVPLTGLTPGSTTVTVQYKGTGGNSVTLSKRRLVVWPA